MPSIITLSETRLNGNISDNEIKLDNYVLHRADRGAGTEGVATCVSSNVSSELVIPKENLIYCECLNVC